MPAGRIARRPVRISSTETLRALGPDAGPTLGAERATPPGCGRASAERGANPVEAALIGEIGGASAEHLVPVGVEDPPSGVEE